jgi:signal transduction histidine kinase
MNAQMAERQWAIAPAASPMLLSLLDQIEIGVERTVRILQRIRGENELVVQHHERVDLQAVLDRALEQMAPDCLRLSVQLMHKRSPRPLWCVGDELGFSQVVINLLRNGKVPQPAPVAALRGAK